MIKSFTRKKRKENIGQLCNVVSQDQFEEEWKTKSAFRTSYRNIAQKTIIHQNHKLQEV